MSNQLFMDESNGNGVFASKPNNASTAPVTTVPVAVSLPISLQSTTVSNSYGNMNSNSISISNSNSNLNVNSTSNATAAAVAAVAALTTSVSSEDLSQSLSEYTDADESISAPTEFLAEFLSAVMLKDYKKALKYCKLILQYEPNNVTAKEFYPFILDKLQGATSSDSDENYNKSSSPDLALPSSDPSAGESDEADDQPVNIDDGEECGEEYCLPGPEEEVNTSNSSSNSESSSSISPPSESLSDSGDDDDEDVDDDLDDEEEEDENVDEDIMSSSDDQQVSGAECAGVDGSHGSRQSSSGSEGRSRSDNTTHSYSSLLLEEDDDIVPAHLHFPKDAHTADLDGNGNKVPSTSCSDSESPTEPLTQRLAAILRSKCGVSSAANPK